MSISAHIGEMRTHRPEIDFLLKVSRISIRHPEVDYCRQLLAEHAQSFDWGYFLDQACRHKVIQMAGRNIAEYRLHRGLDGRLLIPSRWIYLDAYTGNRVRNEVQYEEFARVLRALNSGQVRYAIRKGPVLAERLYGDIGLRRMQDLDILVDRSDLGEVAAILQSCGYTQGRLNVEGTSVVPFKSSTRAFWKMFVNNDLPFIKISPHPEVEIYSIDLCLNIFMDRSPASVSTAALLSDRAGVAICGVDSYMLSPVDNFIDLCAHLYKEATASFYIQAGADLQLSKFLDIALSCQEIHAKNMWPRLIETAEKYQATDIVYYALHHTSLAYPDVMPEVDLDALRPSDRSYLDEYGQSDGNVRTWEVSFMDRLFSTARGDSAPSTVPFD